MPRQIALLRGINVGPNNRIAMPALRAALAEAGFGNVRTYVQSGNVVLDAELEEGELAEAVTALIADRFELAVPVVVRSAAELAEVVAENPFPDAAVTAPKRLQVTFLSSRPADEVAERVRGVASGVFSLDTESISVAISCRNVYGWHPQGIHVSKLARELSDRRLGVTATARNWTTVTTLLEMATADAG
ncbi:MAG TPA: DUF1697 domain-containing protein [Solirubrobacteraceae bacterium]|nr:DUF1697 domain-containing protein [Solirubrobacteraceae bacterium]